MCECSAKINEKLEPANARLAYGFTFGRGGGMKLSPPMIELEKVDKTKRGKPPTLLASYCPFCGDRYED